MNCLGCGSHLVFTTYPQGLFGERAPPEDFLSRCSFVPSNALILCKEQRLSPAMYDFGALEALNPAGEVRCLPVLLM